MRKPLILVTLILLYTLNSCNHNDTDSHAPAQHTIDESAAPTELKLTPKFQELLKNEMREIQSAMQEILTSIAKGESEKTARLAEQIHNSFILKNVLSKNELKQLVTLLPANFVKIDRVFHSDAAKLAEAAKQSDFARSAEIFGGMVNACVNCHSRFANVEFPELQKRVTTH